MEQTRPWNLDGLCISYKQGWEAFSSIGHWIYNKTSESLEIPLLDQNQSEEESLQGTKSMESNVLHNIDHYAIHAQNETI